MTNAPLEKILIPPITSYRSFGEGDKNIITLFQ